MGSRRHLLEALAAIADGTDDLSRAGDRVYHAPASGAEDLHLLSEIAGLHRTGFRMPDVREPRERAGRVVGRIQPADARDQQSWNGLVLLEKLGAGSSGDVYRAHDPRLDHDVALKLYRAKAGGPGHGPDVSLLLREGRAMARIRHENVVRVYGADVCDGRAGVWMELVHGRSLASLLSSQGCFSAAEATLIGKDLCRALAAVHLANIVHGDVKVQNVVREDGGRHVLMDFGSWRPRDGRHAPAGPLQSTPLYLAPEAFTGAPMSIATDIYALGVLLFHLVTGDFPVKAASLEALAAAHAAGRRASLMDLRPDLPSGFVDVVARAIDRDPGQRFRTAGDLLAALASLRESTGGPTRARARLQVAGLLAVTLAAVALLLPWRPTPAIPPSPSVSVLPFTMVGAPQGFDFLADALSEDATVQLSKLAGLRVVSARGGLQEKGTAVSSSEIGRRLQVASVLTGSARIVGSRVRVFVELVDTASSRQVWADTFDGTRDDIAALQTRVVRGIAEALRGQLTSRERATLGHEDLVPEAFEAYLRGRYFWSKRTAVDLRTSIELFEQALAIQSNAALAHAGLADAYLLSTLYGLLPSAEGHRLAESSALRALGLDSGLAEAHAALASVYHEQWRFAEAEQHYQRAIALNASYATAHHWYAIYLAQLGRFAEARHEIDHALALDPWSATIATARGVVLYVARDYESAIAQYESVLARAPEFTAAHSALAEAYAMAGRYDDARASLERSRALAPAFGRIRALDAFVVATTGDHASARRLLAEAEAALDPSQEGSTDIAATYALLGARERAAAWLERAAGARDGSMLYIGVEPRYDRLRDLVNVREILARHTMDAVFAGAQE